jgi:hypothetical protein
VTRRSAFTALALALLAAGCGKSAIQQFTDNLKPLEKQVADQKAQLAATLRTVRLRNHGDAQLLRREIQALGVTNGKIARLKGPSEVKTPLARLAGASAAQVGALNSFAAALESGGKASLNKVGEQAQLSEGAVRRADDALHAVLNPQ